MNSQTIVSQQERVTFSLSALLEYSTVCGVLSALIPASGLVASVFLAGMALALGARQGLLALAFFFAASFSADAFVAGPDRDLTWQRQGMVLLTGTLLCVWYLLRRRHVTRRVSPAE